MKLVCLHCGKSFEGESEKFCTENCKNSYIVDIDRRTEKTVKEDTGHTNKMSRDE